MRRQLLIPVLKLVVIVVVVFFFPREIVVRENLKLRAIIFICNIPDAVYMDNSAYKVMQLTAWIPVMDADRETGCLQVLYNGDSTYKLVSYCKQGKKKAEYLSWRFLICERVELWSPHGLLSRLHILVLLLLLYIIIPPVLLFLKIYQSVNILDSKLFDQYKRRYFREFVIVKVTYIYFTASLRPLQTKMYRGGIVVRAGR